MKTRLFALYPEGFVHVLEESKVCALMTFAAALVHPVPSLVKTFPLVPGAVLIIVPSVFGSVSVELAEAAPASRVTAPPPVPLIPTGIRQCSKLIRMEQ
jgi:hypothetical protein